MTKHVADVMTPGVAAVGPDDSVAVAARAMRENDVGAVPVVEDGVPIGILTDRDIAVRVVAEGRDPNGVWAAEAASPEPLVVRADQELVAATELMGIHQVRRLPVVDGEGRLVGMLAQADIALAERAKTTGQLLEEISQPTSVARA